MKEQQGEQVGGEGRAGEVSPKTPNRDWNTLHCCVLSPSVTERALPWHVTVNTGRLHGNTAIWQKSMGWDMAPMRQIIPWITISSPSCAIMVMKSVHEECVKERKREHAVKQPCHILELLGRRHTTIYTALIKTQIGGCLGSLGTVFKGLEEERQGPGVKRERVAAMPLGCLSQMPHPGGICRVAP